MKLRDATREDLTQFYGRVPSSMRAIVAEKDGRILGVAGVMYGQTVVAFSDLKDEMRDHKLTIMKAGRMLVEMVKDIQGPVFAKCETPSAARFLERLGFEHKQSNVDGEVYQWAP